MPNNLVYNFGKVSQAVGVLITDAHDARKRVWVASDYLLAVVPRELPTSCREDMEWIRRMLVRYPAEPPHRSRVEATYRRTRNVTASKIAARVWKLYHSMISEIEARDQGCARDGSPSIARGNEIRSSR